MKLIKTTLMMTLSGLLVACGGGGSNGYYGDNTSNPSDLNGENPTTISPIELTKQLEILKREGKFLFGNYDPNDASTVKGYIDHALDTFAQGPLQLSLDIRSIDLSKYKATNYRDKCFYLSKTDYRACYVFVGENIKNILPGYTDWDFDITVDDLKNIKLQHDEISPNLEAYESNTRIYVFENENGDKNFNDVTITGAFAYPFQQSWGLVQTQQKRFILINSETSDYKITTTAIVKDPETGEDTEREVTTGAISIYKDLTSRDGSLYNIQSGSGFNVLINDNPNIPFAEPISFVLPSTPGTTSSASYRIKASGEQELILPSITTIDGTRIENESPEINEQKFTGSIKLTGPNIFKFKKAINETLSFEHIINGIAFKGTSTNNNGTITTTLTQPTGTKF
ncbi:MULTISPECIES: hypothetical protein [unclassified Acinetobacter]|uniref:hypothetical protein n=1 Tax=unclassified Acinetobacter TaxID=196816 RepID=UPI0015D31603|nr:MULTISPECIES: hypothetical protein [unclassified Acinetobacter]